jgi:hypothetical protein
MPEAKSFSANLDLSCLEIMTRRDVERVEQALKNVGAFGEVHLVVERGRLRFIRTVKSESLNGEPSGQK